MKISDEQIALIKLYSDSPPLEKIKIYARIVFNFEQIKKHLEKFIPELGTVFDYGCGYGIFSNYIKLKNPNLNVIGFDISKTRINEARKSAKLTGVNFSNEFDETEIFNLKLVLLIDVLIFLPPEEKINLIKKFYNLLENSGIIFIKDTLKSSSFRFKYTNFEERLKLKLKIYGSEVKAGPYYIGVDEFEKILMESGFKVIDIITENHLIYPGVFIIAQKQHMPSRIGSRLPI